MKIKKSLQKLSPEKRLHNISIPIIGLTGGVATGKSSVSKKLKEQGHPILDADHLVKKIYQKKEVIEFLKKEFPKVIQSNGIDFKLLRELVFSDSEIKKTIESTIYAYLPSVFKEELLKIGKVDYLIYDVPLLFELNMQNQFDITVLVYASKEEQIKRLMKRDSISKELAQLMLSSQKDIEEKKEMADFIIDNSQDPKVTEEEINSLCRKIFDS